jgi:putative acetyltransferase
MIIRPEQVADYTTIAALHTRAFGNRPAEANIVALHRQRLTFDPELSLVAEINGQVIGHVLFSPHQMRLLGQSAPTVNLAPIAVDPNYQGRGIGGQLIVEGHRLAVAKGYKVSILLGHTSYYPRFGYHTHAFGSAQVEVSIKELSYTAPKDILETRHPTDEDVPRLRELWLREEGMVDMALEPGLDLRDWLSPNPAIQATVYTRQENVIGYTRIHNAEPAKPRVFLAWNHEAARAIAAIMINKLRFDISRTDSFQCLLPLHPSSASAEAFGKAISSTKAASMACPLAPSPFDEYLTHVRVRQRPPGRVIWPTAFDLS